MNENETSESLIHFYAEEITTKTEFGAISAGQYPTLWTSSKGIKISYNKKTSVEASVTPKDGNTKADFTPVSAFSNDGSGAHIFYAMSPSSAQGANISTTYYSWRFIVPTSQTPLDDSVDEDAQILYAKYDAGASFPDAVPFSFNHVTAYGKLSFANLALDGDEDITSITLTASKNWVGEWYYYVATKSPNTENDFKEASASKKITLNTDKSSDIWFSCAPVDLSDGGTIDINIFTNKGVFTKKVTFPEGKGNFTAGHVGTFTVNMSGISRSAMVNDIVSIRNLYTSANVPFVANLTDALVTIVSGDNFYMQDSSGGIYVYTAGHGMSVGDKLNGIISGTVTNYYGIKEIIGLDCSAAKTTGNTVTPTTVAHATLVDNFADYESEYVKVEGLTVSEVNGKDITVSDNANLKIRNESGQTITVGTQMNAVGAAVFYNTTKQVKIYALADADLIKIGSVITASDKGVAVGGTISIGATTNSTATITYVSSDETVATVDDSGVITGVKAGTATITCSVAASGKYLAASKNITVTVSASASPIGPWATWGATTEFTIVSNTTNSKVSTDFCSTSATLKAYNSSDTQQTLNRGSAGSPASFYFVYFSAAEGSYYQIDLPVSADIPAGTKINLSYYQCVNSKGITSWTVKCNENTLDTAVTINTNGSPTSLSDMTHVERSYTTTSIISKGSTVTFKIIAGSGTAKNTRITNIAISAEAAE